MIGRGPVWISIVEVCYCGMKTGGGNMERGSEVPRLDWKGVGMCTIRDRSVQTQHSISAWNWRTKGSHMWM